MYGGEEKYIQGFCGETRTTEVGEIILKWILNKMERHGLHLSRERDKWGWGGSCKHGNKLSGSIKCGEFID
jgi:hypothetical protein